MNYKEWVLYRSVYTHFTIDSIISCEMPAKHIELKTTNVWAVTCPKCIATQGFQEAKSKFLKKPKDRSRGIRGPAKPEFSRLAVKCWYCSEFGHTERKCQKKRHELG